MSTLYTKKDDPKRQQLLPDPEQQVSQAAKDIEADLAAASPAYRFEQQVLESATEEAAKGKTLADLHNDLQTAMELELSTIPPYLSALYSIKEGTNRESVEIIRSVVVEEMLHMVMVANLLNAVGGKPVIGKFTPDYPSKLPGNVMPKLTVPLAPFGKDSIRTFEKIEHPEGGLQFLTAEEKDKVIARGQKFTGIGEFYSAIKKTIEHLEAEANAKGETIFIKGRNQVYNDQYYGAGGKIITVSDLDDAKELIDEIVGQGEGTLGTIFSAEYDPKDDDLIIFGPDVEEYAHYFRFKEIRFEQFYAITDSAHRDSHNGGLPTGTPFKVDWDAIYNFKPNPKLEHYKKDTPIYQKTLEFNQTYQALLNNINDACNGQPDLLVSGITIMYDLKYKALELMKIPLRAEDLIDPSGFEEGYTAGPSFELADC